LTLSQEADVFPFVFHPVFLQVISTQATARGAAVYFFSFYLARTNITFYSRKARMNPIPVLYVSLGPVTPMPDFTRPS
jgi:hypothetical protein